MEIGMALDPKEVARDTLRALGRQSVVLPGWISKLIIYGMLPLPRWFRVKMMGGVMKSIGNRE
jgi:short-subunit dehydrogenase